jgi:hypothetical protein
MSTATKSKSHSRRKAGVLLLVGVLAGVTISGGAGVIAASSTKSVTVCVDKIDKHMNYSKSGLCKSHQTKLVLNKAGTTGVKGETGAAGAMGTKGDAGAAGNNGATGVKGDTGAAGAGSANANSQIKNICGDNGVTACAIGLKGPGGGVVFITPSTLGNTSGLFYEAAPNTWSSPSGDPQLVWCNNSSTLLGVANSDYSSQGPMNGAANTSLMVGFCGSSGAANFADGYTATVNSVIYGDWFLPSRRELNEMYINRVAIGGLNSGIYRSSSEFDANFAWVYSFTNGIYGSNLKTEQSFVRPVRAF